MEMRSVNNKKGQNLTLGSIIIIVLGLVVLAFLILGFSVGFNNLFDTAGQFSGKSNTDVVRQACALACSTNSEASFCTDERTLKFGEKVDVNGEDVSSVSVSCDDISNNPSKYNNVKIDSCPSISCTA